MSYTVGDWLRQHAEMQVRVPDGLGGWTIEWVPVDTGNLIDYDRLRSEEYRTAPGHELKHFRGQLAAYRERERQARSE